MKAWYLIDDCTTKRAFMDEVKLDVTTKEEAIAEMHSTWDALSEHDKRDRDAFWVALFDADEDGIIDFDTAENEYTIQMY